MLLYKLRQFYEMPNADRGLLLRIALIVPCIEIGLRLAGFKRVLTWLHLFSREMQPAEHSVDEVERHGRLLFTAYRQMPFAGRCLARSLTIWLLLRRKGICTDLRFGTRKQGGKLLAHAWIEHNGVPLKIDSGIREKYSTFSLPVSLGIEGDRNRFLS
jgi:hypothetical protein